MKLPKTLRGPAKDKDKNIMSPTNPHGGWGGGNIITQWTTDYMFSVTEGWGGNIITQWTTDYEFSVTGYYLMMANTEDHYHTEEQSDLGLHFFLHLCIIILSQLLVLWCIISFYALLY